MKRIFIVIVAVLAALSFMVTPTFAAHPHFTLATATGPDDAAALAVHFQEAGLGNTASTTYVASADVSVTDACVDAAGVITVATIVNTPVSATLTSPDNGQNTRTLTLVPPVPKIVCKATETAVIANITYSNVTVADTTNGITQSIPGTFNRVFFS